jgi:hypothetical protein
MFSYIATDMKHSFFVFILMIFFSNKIFSQEDTSRQIRGFEMLEINAAFPGGDKAWSAFVAKNLNANVPVNRNAPAGRYIVMVTFAIDTTGAVVDISAKTRHGYGMEEEVIRVLQKSPLWNSAVQGGKRVKALRNQPVSFVIAENNKERRKARRS